MNENWSQQLEQIANKKNKPECTLSKQLRTFGLRTHLALKIMSPRASELS